MEVPLHAEELLKRLQNGDRAALARAITLVESTRAQDRASSSTLLDLALPMSGKSLRVGITGIPGVGKSTLIDAMGRLAIQYGHRVAVLATDPSSARNQGSILGDKTRMEELSRSEQAFIRPTPTSGHLGGVARHTRETMVLCEAAGYDLVLVETVGVGQSELEVDGLTDLNLVLMIPGAGDELQGIKRGIMESADVLVLTKADASNDQLRIQAANDLRNAVMYLPTRESGRQATIIQTDALSGKGIAELWTLVLQLSEADRATGYRDRRREQQNVQWLRHALREGLLDRFLADPSMVEQLALLEDRVKNGQLGPDRAATDLIDSFRTSGARLP